MQNKRIMFVNSLLLDNQKIIEEICVFLKKEFKKTDRTIAVMGLSGGIDSTVVAILCQRAKLELQTIFMPYGKLSRSPKEFFLKQDITQAVDLLTGTKIDRINKGNIMARVRMTILYDLARKLNGLVVGTGNLSEYYLGYFTLYGDQACDINPIGGLFKTQVIGLAKFLGAPLKIPSAELYKGQTDEKELGFSYQEADPILYLYCKQELGREKIIEDFGFNSDLVNKVIERVKATEYKRRKTPKYKLRQ